MCFSCSSLFRDKYTLRKHTSQCSTENEKSNKRISRKSKTQSPISSEHSKSLAPLTPNRSLATLKFNLKYCIYCKLDFETLKEIGQHYAEKHKTIKMFTCTICGKGSSNEQYMKLHEANDHRKNPKKTEELETNCPICLTSLSSIVEVVEHFEDFHSGQLYPCPACHDIFEKRTVWKMHWLSEHANKPPTFRFAAAKVIIACFCSSTDFIRIN